MAALHFAGTIVRGNIWAVLHDEKHYPEPETFKPERFLDADRCYKAPDRMYMAPFGAGENLEQIIYLIPVK